MWFQAHSLQDCTRSRRQQSSLSSKPNLYPRKSITKLRARQQKHNRPRLQPHRTRTRGKVSARGGTRRTSLPPRVEMSTVTKLRRMVMKKMTITRKGKTNKRIRRSILLVPRLLIVRWTLASCLMVSKRVHGLQRRCICFCCMQGFWRQ